MAGEQPDTALGNHQVGPQDLGATVTIPSSGKQVDSRLREAFAWGASLAIALRIGLGIVMAAAWLAIRPNLASVSDASLYGQLNMPTSTLGQLVLGVWPRWDAVHHLNLAMRGYHDLSPGDSVFYPLYAFLTRIVAVALGGEFILAGLIVSTVSAAVALALLRLIGDHVYGPPSGRWASLSLAAYPTSVFLIAPFTESLFLALTLGAVYFAYKERWLPSSLLAFFGSLSRGPGIFLAVPLALIAYQQVRERLRLSFRADLVRPSIAAVAPLVGGLAFLAWRSMAGFPPMTETLQQYSVVSFVDPLTGLLSAIRQWGVIHDLPTTLDTFSALLFLGTACLMVVFPRWRRVELVTYMVLTLAFLLSVNAQPASSLKGISRYVLALFPAFLLCGDFLSRARPGVRLALLVSSSALLVLISSLYALWFYVG